MQCGVTKIEENAIRLQKHKILKIILIIYAPGNCAHHWGHCLGSHTAEGTGGEVGTLGLRKAPGWRSPFPLAYKHKRHRHRWVEASGGIWLGITPLARTQAQKPPQVPMTSMAYGHSHRHVKGSARAPDGADSQLPGGGGTFGRGVGNTLFPPCKDTETVGDIGGGPPGRGG